MLPTLFRRCPNCRRLGFRRRFAPAGEGQVECPSCGHRFDPGDDPRLN